MTVRLVQGDIIRDTADAIVCPVNTVGVMGAGLARAFAERYPTLLSGYKRACKDGWLTTECVFLWHEPRPIVCLATKADWRDPSKLEYVTAGLSSLALAIRQERWTSVAIPALGAGLGRLPWEQVEQAVRDFGVLLPNVDVRLYPPR